jgi:osmoprotectant transport system ATP-binding protein
VIRLVGISKSYAGARILGPISLEVGDRTTLALVGSSGCGKSTLLRTIVGLVSPDEGRVEVAGEPMTPLTAQRLRRRIGYVIQDGGLFPHLTARGNAMLMAQHLGWPRDRIAARLGELAALARLRTELLDRYPAELSGGERQRVSLVRALFLDPDVMLLDEPLGALDALVRAELQQELRTIFRTLKKTAILVTHDLSEAAFVADEIAVMRDGVILQRGSIDDLVSRPGDDFVSRLVGAQRSLQVGGTSKS